MVMRTPDEAVSMTVAVTGSREEDEAEVEAEVEVSVEEEEEEASGPEGSHQFKLLRGGRTPHGVILTSRRRSRRGGGGRRRGGGGGGRCERLDLERSDLGVDVLVVGRVDHEEHLFTRVQEETKPFSLSQVSAFPAGPSEGEMNHGGRRGRTYCRVAVRSCKPSGKVMDSLVKSTSVATVKGVVVLFEAAASQPCQSRHHDQGSKRGVALTWESRLGSFRGGGCRRWVPLPVGISK